MSFGTFVAIRKVLSNVLNSFLWKDDAQILMVLLGLRLCQQVSTDRLCHQEESKKRRIEKSVEKIEKSEDG